MGEEHGDEAREIRDELRRQNAMLREAAAIKAEQRRGCGLMGLGCVLPVVILLATGLLILIILGIALAVAH